MPGSAKPSHLSIAWKNGRWLPLDQAGPSLADAGWVQGATVVDVMRTCQGKPFLLERHLDRFYHDCHHLGIQPAWTRDQAAEVVRELLVKNQVGPHPHRAWCVVLLATPGPLSHYGTHEPPGATLIIHGYPLPRARYSQWVAEGAHLVASTVPAAVPGPVDPRVKHRSRLHWWMAENLASRESPGALPVLLTAEGNVTETSLAHLAWVTQRGGRDVLIVPPAETILDGISLNLALELCEKLGLSVQRSTCGWRELQGAKEAFLTGSAFGLCGVSQIGHTRLPFPGPWTLQLQKAWQEVAGEPVDASFR
jgi:branched-subunit amino acid aminotransferase/4-amino-4-deoxychorismate lyase